MKEAFFTATQNALKNITSTFDVTWPIVVSLWSMRCQVNGVLSQCPNVTEQQLAARFCILGAEKRGVDFMKSFSSKSWMEQQGDFAWILLNAIFPIYEGWLEELRDDVFPSMNMKNMQYPTDINSEISRLTALASPLLTAGFYPEYSQLRDRCYSKIENLLKCFRYFKEMRNCYMHNNRIANSKLVNAYNDYIAIATTNNLDASEAPEALIPTIGHLIPISLRGVVGFSYNVIKIIVSCDAELLKSKEAEREFDRKFSSRHGIIRTLTSSLPEANRQVAAYIRQCGLPAPPNLDDFRSYLLEKRLLSR